MPQLKDIQKKYPNADTVAGKVVVFHEGKHYELGDYAGDGVVVLSREGETLMAPKKPEVKKPAKSLDITLDDLEL